MELNPYAPPTATVADPAPDSHGLKRRRVIVMILFTLATFGLYYFVWWFRRRPGLNRLNSFRKLALWPLLLMAAINAIQIAIAILAGQTPVADVIGSSTATVLNLVQFAIGVLMIVQSFRIKDMIEDHATPESGSGPMFGEHVQLSGLMTFFFSIYYLQWAINHYIVDARNRSVTG
jgi:hypothetical protein